MRTNGKTNSSNTDLLESKKFVLATNQLKNRQVKNDTFGDIKSKKGYLREELKKLDI
jgi:hypothetical protein